jgi:hypothetical protein
MIGAMPARTRAVRFPVRGPESPKSRYGLRHDSSLPMPHCSARPGRCRADWPRGFRRRYRCCLRELPDGAARQEPTPGGRMFGRVRRTPSAPSSAPRRSFPARRAGSGALGTVGPRPGPARAGRRRSHPAESTRGDRIPPAKESAVAGRGGAARSGGHALRADAAPALYRVEMAKAVPICSETDTRASKISTSKIGFGIFGRRAESRRIVGPSCRNRMDGTPTFPGQRRAPSKGSREKQKAARLFGRRVRPEFGRREENSILRTTSLRQKATSLLYLMYAGRGHFVTTQNRFFLKNLGVVNLPAGNGWLCRGSAGSVCVGKRPSRGSVGPRPGGRTGGSGSIPPP